MEKKPLSMIGKDKTYIWHPFTQMKMQDYAIPIVSAKGAYLYSDDGQRYLDGISSWWVNLHGHTHPYIANKIKKQLYQLEHVIFSGFTHEPACELASRLLPLLPGSMSKIFYSDNGSTAVEIAIKMALQYWHNQNIKKTKVICFKNSYHGDTFGAMSVAGKNEFNRPFWNLLFDVETIDPPIKGHEDRSLVQLKKITEKNTIACFIFEPLVLGSGGMIMYPKEGLDSLIEHSKSKDILTIADEVMTGFGRTGTLFACDALTHTPDIICLSKGITGGFLPLGATCCTKKIFDAFLNDDLRSAFLHGHSYTANPLACAASLASLDLLQEEKCTLQRDKIFQCHKNFCNKWHAHPMLKRCEVLGTILALEYKDDNSSYFHAMSHRLYHYFLSKNILLRPLGNVLYILPPYCIKESELQTIYEHIIETLEGAL